MSAGSGNKGMLLPACLIDWLAHQLTPPSNPQDPEVTVRKVSLVPCVAVIPRPPLKCNQAINHLVEPSSTEDELLNARQP